MDAIKETVLKKALAMLAASGSQFAVIDADGVKHGTLEVVPPKVKGDRKKSGIKFKPLFDAQLSAIEPGETIHVFTPPQEIIALNMVENYRSALCGHCSARWGSGTYTTEIKGNEVHLLRWS